MGSKRRLCHTIPGAHGQRRRSRDRGPLFAGLIHAPEEDDVVSFGSARSASAVDIQGLVSLSSVSRPVRSLISAHVLPCLEQTTVHSYFLSQLPLLSILYLARPHLPQVRGHELERGGGSLKPVLTSHHGPSSRWYILQEILRCSQHYYGT